MSDQQVDEILALKKLRIPMRGYETDTDVAEQLRVGVTNPHEGL